MSMVKAFLFSANIYYGFLSPEMRSAFRRDQFIMPFLLSTGVLFMLKFPLTLYEALMLIIPIFILLPLFWGIGRFPVFYFEETEKKIRIHYRIVILTLVVFLLFRIWCGIGINIG
jgi:hypothetical protein